MLRNLMACYALLSFTAGAAAESMTFDEKLKAGIEFYNAAAKSGSIVKTWKTYDKNMNDVPALAPVKLSGHNILIEGAPWKIEVQNFDKQEYVINGNVFRPDTKAMPSDEIERLSKMIEKKKYSLFNAILPQAFAGTSKWGVYAFAYGVIGVLDFIGCESIAAPSSDHRRCAVTAAGWMPLLLAEIITLAAGPAQGAELQKIECVDGKVKLTYNSEMESLLTNAPVENKSNIPDSVVEAAKKGLIASCPDGAKAANEALAAKKSKGKPEAAPAASTAR